MTGAMAAAAAAPLMLAVVLLGSLPVRPLAMKTGGTDGHVSAEIKVDGTVLSDATGHRSAASDTSFAQKEQIKNTTSKRIGSVLDGGVIQSLASIAQDKVCCKYEKNGETDMVCRPRTKCPAKAGFEVKTIDCNPGLAGHCHEDTDKCCQVPEMGQVCWGANGACPDEDKPEGYKPAETSDDCNGISVNAITQMRSPDTEDCDRMKMMIEAYHDHVKKENKCCMTREMSHTCWVRKEDDCSKKTDLVGKDKMALVLAHSVAMCASDEVHECGVPSSVHSPADDHSPAADSLHSNKNRASRSSAIVVAMSSLLLHFFQNTAGKL